jgi:hypothetical protein
MKEMQCKICKTNFLLSDKSTARLSKGETAIGQFCSKKCANISMSKKITSSCCICGSSVEKLPSALKKSKCKKFFCSKSCAGKYNSTHKTKGTNRSKLEKWLEQKLTKLYPDLEFCFNQSHVINAELDIYIPSLKLAVELNGIFHYEPIFGDEKLIKTQNNDNRKILASAEKGIDLCVIDTTSLTYFKENGANNFLEIIKKIINQKINILKAEKI